MTISYFYVDGLAVSHTIYIAGTSTASFISRGSEQGHLRPPQKTFIEPTPSQMAQQFRAVIYEPRVYSFEVQLINTSAANLETALANWEDWHDALLGEGYIKRITAGGTTRCLDAIPIPMEGLTLEGYTARFRQTYHAANPWWRTESQSTASGNFNGATPVNISVANAGDIATWPVITITGIIVTPKIANAAGEYIEVNKTTTNADDVIVIDCRPNGTARRTVKFWTHGVGAATFCTITSASRYITLPKGTNNAVISAASGTATCKIDWFVYYGSLM